MLILVADEAVKAEATELEITPDMRPTQVVDLTSGLSRYPNHTQATGMRRLKNLRPQSRTHSFFRIGTRVLYCQDQLTEFLKSCERNGRKAHDEKGSGAQRHVARRKDHRVSSSRTPGSTHERTDSESVAETAKVDQASSQTKATQLKMLKSPASNNVSERLRSKSDHLKKRTNCSTVNLLTAKTYK